MAITRKTEERALDAEERDLVAKSHHPALQELSDRDLAQLVKLVRERRDRAKTQANQRRREIHEGLDGVGQQPHGPGDPPRPGLEADGGERSRDRDPGVARQAAWIQHRLQPTSPPARRGTRRSLP